MDYTIIFGSIATTFNVIIIYYKFTHDKIMSGAIDIAVLVALSWLFIGTISGLSIGMIASFFFSIYLLIAPPKQATKTSEFDEMFKSM
jgi:hypothetical protein